MQLIRLPLRMARDEDKFEDIAKERMDLNVFVKMFVNQAVKELKDALSRFHSI